MLVLVQCLTGDGWSTLMSDVSAGPERGCDPNKLPHSDCGNQAAAYPYFLSFMFFGTFVLLNLIVAVILEHFSALGNVNPDLVSSSDIADFGEKYGQFDEDLTAEITKENLASLLLVVPKPLGLLRRTLTMTTSQTMRT